MKETTIKIKQYEEECPRCKKKIKGFNKKQLEWNFKIHLDSCRKRKK